MNTKNFLRNNQVQILDCTLRDGGYYTNWFFSNDLVKNLLLVLNRNNVNYIEIGYRSIHPDDHFGPFRFCRESFIENIIPQDRTELAVMVDLKEIETEHNLEKIFPPATDSPVSLVRLSGYHRHTERVNSVSAFLRSMGYKTSFNYMGVTLLSEKEMLSGLGKLNDDNLDIIYFSDSFGNMTPESIPRFIEIFKNQTRCKIGFHGHNNQGLALENTLTAIKHGLDIADSTVNGMGRGAGNTKTEELLLNLKESSDRALQEMLKVQEKYFIPLIKQYNWGQSFSYMFCGMMNIHPSYCQYLKNDIRLKESEIVEILAQIPEQERPCFNPELLSEKLEDRN